MNSTSINFMTPSELQQVIQEKSNQLFFCTTQTELEALQAELEALEEIYRSKLSGQQKPSIVEV